MPSIAITGTARKVTSAQAMPTTRAAIWPPIPPWFSSTPITRPIAVLIAAQPQIWLKRLRETARPSATVTFACPRKIMSAAAARPTLK